MEIERLTLSGLSAPPTFAVFMRSENKVIDRKWCRLTPNTCLTIPAGTSLQGS